MSKILIWRQIVPGSDIDIFGKTDYSLLYSNIQKNYGGLSPNWGNKLWFQGIYSEIDTPDNEITFRTNETIDEINEKYDLIIWPMANFFHEKYASDMPIHTSTLKQIKIPLYIIACGVQASDYDDLDRLIGKIGDPSSRFIDAVYKTGGEFALRGYFSKEFFTKLGFNSAVVTGCPSMYQHGRDFSVSEKKVSHEDIKPIITGKINYFEDIMKQKKDSVYLSQEIYADCLYNRDYFKARSLRTDMRFVSNYSPYQAYLLGQGRIKMICDTNEWYHFIKDNGFNFAFGTKIHGSIMPILAGTPAMLIATDSRTLEMAEFFDIPHISIPSSKRFTMEDFYDAYDQMDYSAFNKTYRERFDRFESFLSEHKIVRKINDSNRFFLTKSDMAGDAYQPNKEKFIQYAKQLEREQFLLKSALKLKSLKGYIKK